MTRGSKTLLAMAGAVALLGGSALAQQSQPATPERPQPAQGAQQMSREDMERHMRMCMNMMQTMMQKMQGTTEAPADSGEPETDQR